MEKALQAIEINQAGFCSGVPGHPPACAYNPNCLAANLDGNLPIDLTDLAILTAGWLQAEPGDIDQSGQVNFSDYRILARYWLSDCINTESQATAWAKSPPYALTPDCHSERSEESQFANAEENLVQMTLRDSFNPELLFAYLRLRAESELPWHQLTPQLGLTETDNQFIRDKITTNRDAMIAREYESMLTDYRRLTRSPTLFWEGKPIRTLSDLPFDFIIR